MALWRKAETRRPQLGLSAVWAALRRAASETRLRQVARAALAWPSLLQLAAAAAARVVHRGMAKQADFALGTSPHMQAAAAAARMVGRRRREQPVQLEARQVARAAREQVVPAPAPAAVETEL
jgi:hypothetical protein